MDNIAKIAKSLGIKHNVTFRVIDRATNKIVKEYRGHNQGTNTLITGIAHYLCGDGVLNQGYDMLSRFVPRYISLGTMGLFSQAEDEDGLPAGVGNSDRDPILETEEEFEKRRYREYMDQIPGYGADGYDPNQNNGRYYLGLGPTYPAKVEATGNDAAVKCELISPTFHRFPIVRRDIMSETESELPQTIDVVYSTMISTGALAQFRAGADHIFITEAGLWADSVWKENGTGLLAGYRLIPPNENDWDMNVPENRKKVQENIIRVGINQVVQVIWKLQIGSKDAVSSYMIYLDKREVTLAPGATTQLNATTYPPGLHIQWSSVFPDIATVNWRGEVTALSPGRTSILAQIWNVSGSFKTARCIVTVADPNEPDEPDENEGE